MASNMSRPVEVTVLLPLELSVAAGVIRGIAAVWPNAALAEPTVQGGTERMVFLVDADDMHVPDDDDDDDDPEVHSSACSDDGCPCFLAGCDSTRAELAERSVTVVKAATRLIETLTPPA